jgi:Flp pilus assembly pilin Flp
MMVAIRRIWAEDDGQDVVEYGLIAMLIATALITAVQALGNPVAAAWNVTVTKFTSAV